jgi:hypothetical protein
MMCVVHDCSVDAAVAPVFELLQQVGSRLTQQSKGHCTVVVLLHCGRHRNKAKKWEAAAPIHNHCTGKAQNRQLLSTSQSSHSISQERLHRADEQAYNYTNIKCCSTFASHGNAVQQLLCVML